MPSDRLLDPGSSPRVRGKPSCQIDCVQHHRLIPACAGKTRHGGWRGDRESAHPRVCGENEHFCLLGHLVGGSSPRVRGKLGEGESEHFCLRLIPACAGKTTSPRSKTARTWAHPRVCGENDLVAWFSQTPGGSSPRVRGKLSHIAADRHEQRLIPACAGKTLRILFPCYKYTAHPRVCGENRHGGWRGAEEGGSSPRVRGKRLCVLGHRGFSGLIPACAGKTRESNPARLRP